MTVDEHREGQIPLQMPPDRQERTRIDDGALLGRDTVKARDLLRKISIAWRVDGDEPQARAMQILADQLIDNVEAFVAGLPRNVVT